MHSEVAIHPNQYSTPASHSKFWPPLEQHIVKEIPLANPAQFDVKPLVAQRLSMAAKMSDAIRTLESCPGGIHHPMKNDLAKILDSTANELSCPDSKRAFQLRADLLRNPLNEGIHQQLIALSEKEIIPICGNVTTWHGKSKDTFHSSLFGKVDQRLNKLVSRFDNRHNDVESHLKSVIDNRIIFDPAPRISFCQLLFCGGEANTYPKHFAYFLPEDEGVKKAALKKTIVFSNVYTHMYTKICAPFTQEIVNCGAVGNEQEIEQALTMWFRAHDVCHGVRFPNTDYQVMRCESYWNSMVLQETIADVFGFIVANTGPWTEEVPRHRLDLHGTIYLREALRYLCRGGDDFPDAGAALIQLSYLAKHHYIQLDSHSTTIRFDEQSLLKGLISLAKLLAETALANNESGIRRLFKHYYTDGIRDFVARCGTCCAVLEYRDTFAQQ